MTTYTYAGPTKADRARAHALWADAALKRLEAHPDQEISSRSLAYTVSTAMNNYATEHGLSGSSPDAADRSFHDALLPKRHRWQKVVPAADLNAVLARDPRFTQTDVRAEYGGPGTTYGGRGRKVKFWMLTERVDAYRAAAEAKIAADEEAERVYKEKRAEEIMRQKRLDLLTEEIEDLLSDDYATEDTDGAIVVVRTGPGWKTVVAIFRYQEAATFMSRSQAVVFADGVREGLFRDAVNAELKHRLEAE